MIETANSEIPENASASVIAQRAATLALPFSATQ
jgi:hypothetical protein